MSKRSLPVYLDKITWDPIKDKKLRNDRGVGFEDVLNAFREDRVLTTINTPNQTNSSRAKGIRS